jgi:hypothetical protein
MKVREMTRNRLLQAAAGAALLSAATGGVAHAVPSYGYAELGFTNFTLTGVVNPDGTPATGVSSVTSSVLGSDSAQYPGATPAGNVSNNGTITSGISPGQATAGPGAFPGSATFTQALLPATSLTPAGTRGDVQITGAIASGATSNIVSEGKLSVPSATASSSAGTSTTLNVQLTTTNTVTVGLSFNAVAALQAIVGTNNDSANAQISASFAIQDLTTGQAVNITSNNSNATSGTNIAPSQINQSRSATTTTPSLYSLTSTPFSFTATLAAGDSYQITLQDNSRVLLGTGAIPEPASLSILGSGMLALGLFRARRKKG